MPRQRVAIGTIEVDPVTFGDALSGIAALVDSGGGGAVFTPNVDHVMLAERHIGLRSAYTRCNLSLADGAPIVWASYLLGPSLPEKVSGSDLLMPLIELAAKRKWRVYLLGGAQHVAEAAAGIFSKTYHVNVVGTDDTLVSLDPSPTDQDIVARIVAQQPQLLLVALGCPKQELFIDRVRGDLGPTVSVGIGASLDFVVGRVSRAPRWMSKVGLEWMYRLMQEPRRLWRRYLVQDPQFALVVVRSLLARRSATT